MPKVELEEGEGEGLVLYATQECAQPALFIAPPRYRIHSRQKQPRQTCPRERQCGPYLFTAIPRFWYQLALWVFRDVDSVCLTASRLDVSVRLGGGKLRQRLAGGRNLIHNNNATRLKERFTFQTQWQPRAWGSHSPSKQREGSGVPLKILMSCEMVEFVKEQASERVSQLRG